MMSRVPANESTPSAALQPEWARKVLVESLPLDWANVGEPGDVRIERYWPSGDKGLAVEWSFQLDDGRRYHVYATIGSGTADTVNIGASSAPAPRLEHGSLRGVSVLLRDGVGMLHSPDCDSRLTHLPTCLSADAMGRRLEQIHPDATPDHTNQPVALRCRLMGYRAGRRAVIWYTFESKNDSAVHIVGKTFHDDRGSRLVDLHARLNEEFAKQGATWLHVPQPVGYDAELHMARFLWTQSGGGELSSTMRLRQATGALACIHATTIDDLPVFTAEDEAAIVHRWLKLMTLIGGAHSETLATLADKLDAISPVTLTPAVGEAEACTIHRDYYPSQLVFQDDQVTVMDIDTLATGSVCVDLGNFLAHLLLSELDRGGSVADWAHGADKCLHHYESVGSTVSRSELAYYLGTSLFRVGAVHAHRTATGRCAKSLWRVAEELTCSGVFDPSLWSDPKRSCSKVSTC